eukprot:6153056-Ditylum_brightwellii.AAC.1
MVVAKTLQCVGNVAVQGKGWDAYCCLWENDMVVVHAINDNGVVISEEGRQWTSPTKLNAIDKAQAQS